MNYLAPFALTSALLPLLRESAPSRVLSLTAAVEPIGRLTFSDLQGDRHYGGLRAYSQSKKALAMYTTELARRERELGQRGERKRHRSVPGQDRSDRRGDGPLALQARPPTHGPPGSTSARWVARAAPTSRLADTTGRHFILGRRVPSPPGSRNRRRASRLWKVSVDLTTPSRTTAA